MKFLIALSCVFAVAVAAPNPLLLEAYKIVPGAPLGPDGRVVDTPEVAHAKIEHAIAHVNQHLILANEAAHNAGHIVYPPKIPALVPQVVHSTLVATPSAYHVPSSVYHHKAGEAVIGPNGQPLKTPEVVAAELNLAQAHVKAHVDHELSKIH